MKKGIPFIVFAFFVALYLTFGIATVSAQNQPAQAAKEKSEAEETSEEVTKADRESIRVSPRWARKIALRRVPGRVVGWEVEKEDGRVQYEFDIVSKDGKRYEVEVDAMTAKVVEAEVSEP